jgi:hypothetical protein
MGLVWLVIPRYGLRLLFGGKIFLTFCLATWLVPLVFATLIYLRHNAEALAILGLTVEQLDQVLPVGPRMFGWLVAWQLPLAFLAAVRAAPAVVAPDLRGGGLPLYFSRPLTPAGWVAGKVTTVALVLSALTFVPASLCLALQISLDPPWLLAHPRVVVGTIAFGMLETAWIALVSVAVASAVRSKPGAAGAMFGSVIFLAAIGGVVEHQLGLAAGAALQLPKAAESLARTLLGMTIVEGPSLLASSLVLGAIAALALVILRVRIRPLEIVR